MSVAAAARRRSYAPAAAAVSVGPVYRGTTNVLCGSSASGNITVPAATQVGDVVLICVASAGGPPSTPSGYTSQKTVTVAGTGSYIGTSMTVFSKVAVSGDIGAAVTVSGIVAAGWPWSLICRSYGSGGIDSAAGAAPVGVAQNAGDVSGGTVNVPSLTSSVAKEMMVTFGALLHQRQSNSGDGFLTGGSDITSKNNDVFPGYQWSGVEDWALASAGLGSTGGAVSSTGSFPSIALVSLMLKPT